MIALSFNQSRSELMLRVASTLLFNALVRSGAHRVPLRELTLGNQYGYTASATGTPIGPRFVRITDLKDGSIDWRRVPYCECPETEKYQLQLNDVLFARTGATTGKTLLVTELPSEPAIFASYLIRVRPKPSLNPGFLSAFFLSEQYWEQIVDKKEGSAQANVNGEKLARLMVPVVNEEQQELIAQFIEAYTRQLQGACSKLPELPRPLADQRLLVERIDGLAAKIDEAKQLRLDADARRVQLWLSALEAAFHKCDSHAQPIANVLTRVRREVTLQPGVDYLPAGLVNQAKGIIAYPAITSADTKYKSLFAIEGGDLVYSKLKVWEGSLAIVESKYTGRVVSSEFPVFQVDYKKVLKDYLDLWLRRPSLWAWLGDQVRGIGGRKIRVDEVTFLRAPIQLPSIEVQKTMADHVQHFREVTMEVKQLQRDSETELEAMLPAILDRAFRGEL